MSTVNTTINHGITFGATYTSPLTITSSGAVNNNGSGKAIFGGAETVVNYGHVIATGNSGGYGYHGIYLGSGYANNHGTISAAGNAVLFQGDGSVVNSGVLYGGRWGIDDRGGGRLTVTNTGSMAVTGGCCLAAAALIEGSIAHEQARGLALPGAAFAETGVDIENPAGVLAATVDARIGDALIGGARIGEAGLEVRKAAYQRSAQILLRGQVPLYRASPALVTAMEQIIDGTVELAA
jgi:hypothetical protein